MTKLLTFALTASLALGCDAGYLIWIPRSNSADPLYRFIKNGKAGYIDATGGVVIAPHLPNYGSSGSEFHDGLLEVAVMDGKYVDRTGKLVINENLYRGWDFSEGLAVAMRKGEKLFGYIDTSGKFAISPRFTWSPSDYVWPFSDGVAKIKVKDKYGFIDHSGEFVIKPQLLDASDFSDGMARIVTSGPCAYFPEGPCGFANPEYVGGRGGNEHPFCKFTYIDKSGTIISKMEFDGARNFSEGLAPVRIATSWGFIDKTGQMIITPRFEDAYPFHSGLARIRAHGLSGYADRSGSIAIPPQFTYAEDFSDGLAVVGDGKSYWYINQQGDQAFPGKFAVASPFFKGLAHVEILPGTFAYIDHTGRRVFTYKVD